VLAPGQSEPAIQDAVISHCENNKYRFAILDSAEELNKGWHRKDAQTARLAVCGVLLPLDPGVRPREGQHLRSSLGHVAGVYARSDSERGVHKAPANEIVRGALGLKYSISRPEQDFLNPRGINCIRNMGDRGIPHLGGSHHLQRSVVALHQRPPPVPDGRGLDRDRHPVGGVRAERRDALEARDRNISAFLLRIYNSGALMGKTPEEAFYVKCDSETNPPEVVAPRQMVCEIGIAPVKPRNSSSSASARWRARPSNQVL